MANLSPATIIANALLRTFQERGFTIHVEHNLDIMRDQCVWQIRCGNDKQTLRANRHDLHNWDRSKPVPFLGNGPEIYITSAQPNNSEHKAISSHTNPVSIAHNP